jgi:receptor protein-tyrosine kinase
MSFVQKAIEKLHASGAASAQLSAETSAPEHSSAQIAKVPVERVRSRTVTVDSSTVRAEGMLPPEHQQRQIAYQYRQIKRPLIANFQKEASPGALSARVIMVTSAVPGEGKTFTTINLAMSLAKERDYNVLLVDADVAKPHISRLLDLEDERGLLDGLKDESLDLETLIVGTEVPGLTVLPSGRPTEAAVELLGSQRMREMIRTLYTADRARVIVIDSPPLLLTNEARALAACVGQVVVVARAGKTSHSDLREALAHLDASSQSIGLVLNQSLRDATADYYGYGERSA